jgi:hypothetical protein
VLLSPGNRGDHRRGPGDLRRRAGGLIHGGALRVLLRVRKTGWERLRAVSGGLLGALTLVGGLSWLLINASGPHPGLDAAVGVIFAAGGLVLLMPHRIRLPGLVTGGAAAGAALAGTAAGLVASSTQACCSYVYSVARGWPFHWLERGAIAGDADNARRLALGSNWHPDGIALAGDLLLWAYVGMLIVVVVELSRRTAADIEHRSEAPQSVVGPLP